MKPTFKNFMYRIAEANGKEDAIQNIFYGPDGADMAYQHGHITYKDLELILAIIEKLA